MSSSEAQLSTLEPTDPCSCGEVPVLVVNYHSEWGDFTERACPWCFGGSSLPDWIDGVWLDGVYRGGDPELVLGLYVVAFRRAAARRRPDVVLRSLDASTALWDSISAARRWSSQVWPLWAILMLNPHLTAGGAREHLRTNDGEVPLGYVVPRSPDDVHAPASLRDLGVELARVARLMDELAAADEQVEADRDRSLSVEDRDVWSMAVVLDPLDESSPAAPVPDLSALSDLLRRGDQDRPSMLESAERVAAIWKSNARAEAQKAVRRASGALNGGGMLSAADVLGARVALRRALGTMLVVHARGSVRPLLVLWYADRVRTALLELNPVHAFELLPDEHEVLTMAEKLLEPPEG
jgi:hypothetical protein